MTKNIFKIILISILLFCLSNSTFCADAYTIGKMKNENTASDLTYADMEAQFADNVFITKDEEFKIFGNLFSILSMNFKHSLHPIKCACQTF